jgi:predicted Zn-ribbon and HTH transcriptional regulator
MAEEKYICRTCSFEFIAIPGEEEPPQCPECESDDIERLEQTSVARPGVSSD